MAKSRARQFAELLSGGAEGGGSIAPALVSDQANTSTGYFDLPAGTTAQRPETPSVGMLRYNSTLGVNEAYDANGWTAIAAPPSVLSVSPTSFNGASGQVFSIGGSNFDTGAVVKFITSTGSEYNAGSVTRNSASSLSATTARAFTVAEEPLSIKVVNGTGLSAVLESAVDCGGVPTWNTSAGSLSSAVVGIPYSTTLSASDPESQAVTYAVTSGALPTGLSLNAATGVISGTTTDTASTTYSFTVTASDASGNGTARAFSIYSQVTNYFGSGADGVGSF